MKSSTQIFAHKESWLPSGAMSLAWNFTLMRSRTKQSAAMQKLLFSKTSDRSSFLTGWRPSLVCWRPLLFNL